MTLPDGKAGRSLAIAIGGALLALAYLSVVQPLGRLYGGMRDELADLTMQRARLGRIERELPRLQTAVDDMKRRAADKNLLLADASDAVAAASLQTRLQALAANERAEISSVESLPPKAQEGFRRVGIRAVVTADLTALTGILRELAATRPPLFVENLDIRNNGLVGKQAPGTAPTLNVSFEVYGFRAADAPQTVVSR